MRGWQLTFYTQQGRSHGTRSIAEWLVAEAKALGISGATMSTAQGGYGRDGRLHWANFFELSEQPLEVTMALSDEAAERLLARIAAEGLRIIPKCRWSSALPAKNRRASDVPERACHKNLSGKAWPLWRSWAERRGIALAASIQNLMNGSVFFAAHYTPTGTAAPIGNNVNTQSGARRPLLRLPSDFSSLIFSGWTGCITPKALYP